MTTKPDWANLYDAYGPSTDTPGYLADLTSPDPEKRKHARLHLTNNLAHQGTRWEASAHAIPFLIDLAIDSNTPEQAVCLRIALRIALGDAWLDDASLPYPSDRFNAVEGMNAEDFRYITVKLYNDSDTMSDEDHVILENLALIWARDSYEAMSNRAEVLLNLAQSPNVAIAKYAIASLPWFPNIKDQAASLLRTLITSEIPVECHFTALISLALLSVESNPDLHESIRTSLGSDFPTEVRLAASIALALTSGSDDRMLDVLIEAEDQREMIDNVTRDLLFARPMMGYVRLAFNKLGL